MAGSRDYGSFFATRHVTSQTERVAHFETKSSADVRSRRLYLCGLPGLTVWPGRRRQLERLRSSAHRGLSFWSRARIGSDIRANGHCEPPHLTASRDVSDLMAIVGTRSGFKVGPAVRFGRKGPGLRTGAFRFRIDAKSWSRPQIWSPFSFAARSEASRFKAGSLRPSRTTNTRRSSVSLAASPIT